MNELELTSTFELIEELKRRTNWSGGIIQTDGEKKWRKGEIQPVQQLNAYFISFDVENSKRILLQLHYMLETGQGVSIKVPDL